MPVLFAKKAAPAEMPVLKGVRRPPGAPPYPADAPAAARPAVRAPRFQYPLRFWAPLRIAGYGLIALGALNVVSTLRALAAQASLLTAYSMLLLIAAFASLLFSVVAGALIADALPSFEARPEGLAVTEFVRWRVIPWERVVQLRSAALPGERYIVFVEYAGGPLSPEHLVYALLAGLGPRAGVFYSTDITGFDELTHAILNARMRATPGLTVEDLLVENVPMPVLQMALAPVHTMTTVGALPGPDDPDAGRDPNPRPALDRARLVRMQLTVALVPILLFWADNLLNGGIPYLGGTGGALLLGTLGLLVVGLLELPFVALTVQALGENLLGNGDFTTTLRTYPYLEMPRLLAFVGVFALLAIQAPLALVFLAWLAAIAWTAYLVLQFTERLYRIPRRQAALAAGAAGLVQFFVLLVFLFLRAPGFAS